MSYVNPRRMAAIAVASASIGLLSCTDDGPTTPSEPPRSDSPLATQVRLPRHRVATIFSGCDITPGTQIGVDGANLLILDGGRPTHYYSQGELWWYTSTWIFTNSTTSLPISGAKVQLYIPRASALGPTEGYDYDYCPVQENGVYPTPDYVRTPEYDIFTLFTNSTGRVDFIVKGWNPPGLSGCAGAHDNYEKAKVLICDNDTGVRFTVATPNLDGQGGIGANDLSCYLRDF